MANDKIPYSFHQLSAPFSGGTEFMNSTEFFSVLMTISLWSWECSEEWGSLSSTATYPGDDGDCFHYMSTNVVQLFCRPWKPWALKEVKITLPLKRPILNANQHHTTPTRILMNKYTTTKKYWGWCGDKGTVTHCWWECKLVQPLWETIWRLL
jgi:hypothetical protein